MIYASATISLVPEAKGGPFVFWDDLNQSCARAATLGFHGVEIFAPDSSTLEQAGSTLREHSLRLAAAGTGAGWLLRRLHLCHPDATRREEARKFIEGIVDVAGELGAPCIIGSMQGRCEPGVERKQALAWLSEALTYLAGRAARHGVHLLYEPLNRYETDLHNRLAEARDFIGGLNAPNLRLLADLFHMNIEEQSIHEALAQAGPSIGHVHWVDSNRRAAGLGHLNLARIAQTLRAMGYAGFISAEALPYPNSEGAASQTMLSYKNAFAS